MFGRNAEQFNNQQNSGPAKPAVERPGLPPGLMPDAPKLANKTPQPVDELLSQLSQSYQFNARATNTRRAYQNDFLRFKEWCDERGSESLPATPDTISFYLAAHARDFAVASLKRWLVGISLAHKEAFPSVPPPTSTLQVRDTMKGIRNIAVSEGKEPRRAYPVAIDALRYLVEPLPMPGDETPPTLIELRDRALITLAWTCALRSSEVGNIRLSDLRDTPKGFIVTFRKSKTNQEGKPHLKGMPLAEPGNETICASTALRAWLAAMPSVPTAERNRPVFAYVDRHGNIGNRGITPQSVNRLIRNRARLAGFPGEVCLRITCHSLRRGFATAAAFGGADGIRVIKHVGWKSEQQYQYYVAEADALTDSVVKVTGM